VPDKLLAIADEASSEKARVHHVARRCGSVAGRRARAAARAVAADRRADASCLRKTVVSAFGGSMGNAPDAIPQRLARGEPADMIILARSALDQFANQGVVRPESRVDLVDSRIGLAVRAGAPKPDISTVDALRQALLNASSIAYSASASGVYFETELLKRLGIQAEVKPKSKKILSERVAAVVVRGDAEIGFQQISEILEVPGAEFVAPLPDEVQRITVFSAGVLTKARNPDGAAELIRFLASEDAAETIASTGVDPVIRRRRAA
jgi:molybdate transport system substrate-binding protein